MNNICFTLSTSFFLSQLCIDRFQFAKICRIILKEIKKTASIIIKMFVNLSTLFSEKSNIVLNIVFLYAFISLFYGSARKAKKKKTPKNNIF